jgi:hypothetical protein
VEADSELMSKLNASMDVVHVALKRCSLCFSALGAVVGSPAACGPILNVHSTILSDDRSVPSAWFVEASPSCPRLVGMQIQTMPSTQVISTMRIFVSHCARNIWS